MSQRVIDFSEGVAMVVTDLHGDWEAYARYRDTFLRLRGCGEVDRLILCGDLIHSDGPAMLDRSLDMALDVLRLRDEYGPDVVVMLLGNHEMPHIYGFSLSKGEIEYTPRFEAALTNAGTEIRARVTAFFDGLPFYVRTAAGVMIGHAGAAKAAAIPQNAERLTTFSHADLIAQIDIRLAQVDLENARDIYGEVLGEDYDEQARYWLAVNGPSDPRYNVLLRSILLNRSNPDFDLLWETFFMRNEQDVGEQIYKSVLRQFLQVWSNEAPAPQQVLVSGHMAVRGGHQVVPEQQLRIASWAHAHPHEAGIYLLLDCARPVQSPDELLPCLRNVFR